MAINKNHEFEELEGVKCAIVEKNVPQSRIDFLKPLLEFNKFTVVVVPIFPPKIPATTLPANETAEPAEPMVPQAPIGFTIGVTDVMFNPTNAIFGRLLRTPDGKVVTLAYWKQEEEVAKDDVPYFEKK